MPETPVASLDPRQQKLFENARVALERGQLDYALEVSAQILKAAPGCLPVRRLQRLAQLKQHKGKSSLAKTFSGFSSAPFMFGGGKKDPKKQLETAEAQLAKDPTSLPALKMLAEAAGGLDLPETVAFALDAVRELAPDDRANLLALGEAWLAAGKHAEALKTADLMLKTKPMDAEAQNLMRKASIAQTVTKGNWESKESFRDKLKDEAQAVSLEQAAKVVTSSDMTQRLVGEALTRVAQEPANLNHYRDLVQGYRQLGDLDAALSWVRKARLQPAGAADTTLERQEAELQTAILEKRLQGDEAALAAAPLEATLQAKVEATRRELAEYKLTEAKQFVERYPNDYEARHRLALLLEGTGQFDAAIGQYQQAQKNPKVRIAALTGLGRCFTAKKLFDLAVAQFTTAKAELTTMDDEKKDIVYRLGECYQLMGKTEAAMVEFKAVYSEDIGFRDVAEKINAHYAKA